MMDNRISHYGALEWDAYSLTSEVCWLEHELQMILHLEEHLLSRLEDTRARMIPLVNKGVRVMPGQRAKVSRERRTRNAVLSDLQQSEHHAQSRLGLVQEVKKTPEYRQYARMIEMLDKSK